MRHQPGLAYATRHGTFQQVKNVPAEKNSEREKLMQLGESHRLEK